VGHFEARMLFVECKMPVYFDGRMLGSFGSSHPMNGMGTFGSQYFNGKVKTIKLRSKFYSLNLPLPIIEARPEGPSKYYSILTIVL